MFWGLIMEPERRYTQQVKKSFHISMAALDVGSSGNEPSQVMCSYESRNYLLCTLKQPDALQCPLDLEFAAGTEVSFASNGKAHIHLTGYLTDVDDDGMNLEDLAEEETEEEEQVEETKGKKKKHKNLEKNGPPSKKTKLLNGSAKSDEDVEEESEDSDYDVNEEMADSGDGDEEESEDGEEEEDDDEEEEEEAEDEEEQKIPQKLSKKEKKKLKQNADQEQNKSPKATPPQKNQKQNLKGGVVIEDVTEGNGKPAKLGCFVNVYYEGRLKSNNKMFDSTTKGPGFKFRLGAGEVIKAWDTGLVGMKVGGIRKIICPPHTAYGAKGSPPVIPPNATLVFTVTLKKVN